VRTGSATTILTFPPIQNAGSMPPVMDAVPDSIRVHKGKLLVPCLSGFPFPAGAAEIRQVGLDGSNAPFFGGLNSAIDVLPVTGRGGGESFFVLEFSVDQNANAPGRLLRYESRAAAPAVVADDLTSPTNLAYDDNTHTLYISEIFTGAVRALKVA
jgi:hypothetical protein